MADLHIQLKTRLSHMKLHVHFLDTILDAIRDRPIAFERLSSLP